MDTTELQTEVRPAPLARRALPYALWGVGLVGGLLLGVEHHREGVRILFGFRGTEPFPAWVAVGSLLGTVPAVLLALIHPRVAACALWILAASLFLVWVMSIMLLGGDGPSLSDAFLWLGERPVAQALVAVVFWFSRRPGQPD